MNATKQRLLEVEDLGVAFDVCGTLTPVVEEISFSLNRGGSLAIVGESGCGKSVTALSLMRLLPQPYGVITNGSIRFDGVDLLSLPVEALPDYRGKRIGVIFQEPMTALNPIYTIGRQIGEVFRLHKPEMSLKERRERVVDLLKVVGVSAPESRYRSYPHQLSGGMRQRAMIAMALAMEPDLLIADEPTTALDVTIQAQILDLILELQEQYGMALLFITHDMGVVWQIAEDVAVMYAGQVVENGSVKDIFSKPSHPYTRGLLGSIPRRELSPQTPLPVIKGTVPSPQNFPRHCHFYERCAYALPMCQRDPVSLMELPHGKRSRCLRAEEQIF